ncbi:MAG TPA: nucleoside triphosphate pyrophosphohydrolase [Candidatus Dormibacteraeota bacterium]|nr:nucleoside triphosphate pyrophosphohydrolase [Candidatus Dormibacteraeota bacterium]
MLDALVAEARDRWGLDATAGIQVVAAEHLVATPIEASRPLLIVPLVLLAGPAASPPGAPARALPGRHGPDGRDPIEVLRRLYPADAPVARFAAAAGRSPGADATTVGALGAEDLRMSLYLPPVPPELAAAGPWSMPYISARLRQPDGCPWDREQTHVSLRKHLLEEAYEVYDALDRGATPELAEELGDLLLQVVLHAQLAAEAGVFDLADVQASIARKIVRRHPHVFGDAVARTAADVNRQWERIKAGERAEAAGADGAPVKSALDGISPSMPALAASQEMQERASALGYDWPSIEGVLDKVAEELGELTRAVSMADREEEFGDLLLVVVNVGRRLGIESEAALRAANEKFRNRFRRVERMVAERGVTMRDLDFATLDQLWDAAKAEERAAAAERPVTVGSGGER